MRSENDGGAPIRCPPVFRSLLVLLTLSPAGLVLAGCGSGSDSATTTPLAQAPRPLTVPSASSATPAGESTEPGAKKPNSKALGSTGEVVQQGGRGSHVHHARTPTVSRPESPCAQKENALIQKIQSADPSSPRGRRLSRKLHKLTRTSCGTRPAGSTETPLPPTGH